MRSWYDIITPHADIRKGEFDEAIFAADLGDVVSGDAPIDYEDPYLFYKKTYPTQGLTHLLGRVQQTLSTGKGSSVVQIQTPFGGGKTHALVAIYHYLKNGQRIKELLPAGLDLFSPNMAAISGNHWNPIEGFTSEGINRRTFWGELAYQIGGREGYETFRENDEARISPGKDKLRDFLSAYQPFIILFDEILEYINRANDVRERMDVSLGTQTFSFFQELTETVATIPQGMLVVTLPSSYLEDFGDREEESLARLNKIFGRVESIETPVQNEEVYAVIRRRLFEVEGLKTAKMREVVHSYFQLYQQHRNDLPPKVRDASYRDKMELAYPFHPDVIDILYEKWSVIEDLYQREVPIEMILPGDINLDRSNIRQEFLKHIGPEYEGVIASDIAGHEAKSQLLDSANKQWKHLAQCISTSIFYHSFSADDTSRGINLPYIKLAVLRSDTIPALVTDILGKLTNMLWYLNTRADAYYLSRIPNLNPDNRELKLVILHPHDSGEQITEWVERRGNSFREYKNTLFFALADTAGFGKLREDVKTYLALEDIQSEIRSGDSPLPEEKQNEVKTRMRSITRDYSYQVRRMYHVVQYGERSVDLGQPVTGSETLDGWFYRELTSGDLGAILTQLHYRTVVNKFLADNDRLATGVLLDQFYKNPKLPTLSEQGVLARAIQLGVTDGAFGLVAVQDGTIITDSIKFRTEVVLDGIAFDNETLLLDPAISETIIAEQETEIPSGPIPGPVPVPGPDDEPEPGPEPGPEPQPETGYHRVRLVVEGIPASKIADVNRGILLPFSRSIGDFTFTIEIDVSSEEGISPTVIENQVKETIRQIGGRIVEENVG
jgi:hypothetical protein